jgi:hypothetical protein
LRREFVMQIPKRLIVPLAFAIFLGVAFALGASNIITLNHSATITQATATLGIIDSGPTPPTSCPTTGYGPGPVSIGWGSISQNTVAKHYLCVINTGTTSDTISVSGAPPANYGTITSPQQAAILSATPGSNTLPVELDWTVPLTAPVGAVPSFSTTIT